LTNQINTKKNKSCQQTSKLSKKQKAYNKFIQSPEWQAIRVNLFSIRGKKCEQCDSVDRINVHHKTYKRFGGKENPEDLLILCNKCHAIIHKKKPAKKKMTRISYRVLLNSNIDIPKETSTTWKGMARAIALTHGLVIGKISKPKAMKYVKRMCKG